MDELLKRVEKEAGVTPAQAQKAVEVVLDYIKKQLPAPIAGQVDAALRGDLSGLQGMLGGLGAMFGG